MNPATLKSGDRLFGFVVDSITELPKLQNRMFQLHHEITGAKLIHLENDDPNNLFAVAFPTTPQDSTGVAHILEHTALCGSKDYPVRDPFFSMIKRSLKTFMNAFTASDWTMYPFSSQNQKDFYNLMGIYLDAAFHPRLTELNFSQEGHRVEFETADDPSTDLVYKGVVYNEMLGAMSQPSQVMQRNLLKALFPSLTYRHNSGGEPEDITSLTHQQLKEFHQHHYHPSNAFFYTYGDLPLGEHLKKIEEDVLQHFEPIVVHTAVPNEVRYQHPERFEFTYPLDEAEDDGAKSQFALAWLTTDIKDSQEVLMLELLNLVLLGHSGAPLRKALLESKLGKALADGTGFENEIRECTFCVGLQGAKPADFEAIEALVMKTLADVVQEGINEEAVESALHQMEMDTREITGGHYPYSLNLLFRFFGPWVHGGDPVTALDFDQAIDSLKQKIAEPGYLVQKIQEYFIDNPHRVAMSLVPDTTLEKRQAAKQKEALAKKKASLSEAETKQVVDRALELQALQEEEEDLSVLPTLHVSDVPKTIPTQAAVLNGLDGRDVCIYEGATNQINYVQCRFKLDGLTDDERSFLPLVGNLLTQTGKGDLSYEQMAAEVTRYTGGISASPSLSTDLAGEPLSESLVVGSKCLTRNLGQMFRLLKKVLTEFRFDEIDRIVTLLGQRSNNLSNSVIGSGHQYASLQACRLFSTSTRIDSLYDGISQVHFLRDLVKLDPSALSEKLKPFLGLLSKVFVQDRLSVFALGSVGSVDSLSSEINGLFDYLPETSTGWGATNLEPQDTKYVQEAWLTTTPVSYVVRSFKTPTYLHPDAPLLTVLSYLLRAEFLHTEIREKGGAYGGMAGYNSHEGIFTMMSYRDPQLSNTLEVYDRVLDWLNKTELTASQIEEAVLQCISSMDTPQSPMGKAISEYNNLKKGKTMAHRLAFRERVLGATAADLVQVANRWLTGENSVAVVSSQAALDRDQKALEGRGLESFLV